MAQKTTLTLYGLPGRTQSFSPKIELIITYDEYSFLLYIDQLRGLTLNIDQLRSMTLNIDQEKSFTLER